MRIGGALILVAIGAVLTFAINVQHSHGFNINTVGIILMIVGGIWAIAEIAYGFSRRRTEVVQNVGPTGQRTSYSEPNQPY